MKFSSDFNIRSNIFLDRIPGLLICPANIATRKPITVGNASYEELLYPDIPEVSVLLNLSDSIAQNIPVIYELLPYGRIGIPQADYIVAPLQYGLNLRKNVHFRKRNGSVPKIACSIPVTLKGFSSRRQSRIFSVRLSIIFSQHMLWSNRKGRCSTGTLPTVRYAFRIISGEMACCCWILMCFIIRRKNGFESHLQLAKFNSNKSRFIESARIETSTMFNSIFCRELMEYLNVAFVFGYFTLFSRLSLVLDFQSEKHWFLHHLELYLF